MIVGCLLPAVGIAVVGARLYARCYLTRALGIDDIFIVGALLTGIAFSVLVMIGEQLYHNDRHTWVSDFSVTITLLMANIIAGYPARDVGAASCEPMGG
jgi:hypothetical protein